MKRWKLKLENYAYEPLVYAKTSEEAKQVFRDENVLDIQPYDDKSYLHNIQIMKTQSNHFATDAISSNRIREWYSKYLMDGKLRFRLYKDPEDEQYYDIAEYQFKSNDSVLIPCLFTVGNTKELIDKFFGKELYCEIYSYRLWGQPKLKKPDELKGISQSFTVDYIANKCKCQCFVKDNDLWIKHRDFFSSLHKPDAEDCGTPLNHRLKKYFGENKSYLDRFVYSDTWGSIVLRNEAWIVFRNLKDTIMRTEVPPVSSVINAFINSKLLFKSGIIELDIIWQQFFENVCKKYRKFIEEGK